MVDPALNLAVLLVVVLYLVAVDRVAVVDPVVDRVEVADLQGVDPMEAGGDRSGFEYCAVAWWWWWCHFCQRGADGVACCLRYSGGFDRPHPRLSGVVS